MIIGIGMDIVELPRMERIIREKRHFIERVLTTNELRVFDQLSAHRQKEFLGGRFACKEAFSKAWGTGIGTLTFQDIEILADDAGKPVVTKSPSKDHVFVTITHTDTVAAAQIIIEKAE